MKKRIIIIVFVVLLVGVGSLVYFGQWQSQRGELYYSGTIEATNSNLAFQVSGRVINVAVREGYAIKKDQLLAELDPTEFQSKKEQAQANLDRSIKTKDQMMTLLGIYKSTLPADVVRAETNVTSARDVMDDARKNYQRYEQLFKRGVVAEKERDSIKLGYDTAKSKLEDMEAALRQAKSNIKKIEATEKDIEAAADQIKQNKAFLEQADIQLSYARLLAPYNGIITSRNVEPGEVVSPGREVLTMADLETVDLKIFVDETEIGKVKPGQDVDVKIDTFANKVYKGKVTFISPEGEFTPKIIQTKKERVKLVYLVKVSIPNPSLELKSGMPADAWLR
ncbi:MAG TPA: HlyD family efflux transporter periplasmic adaptor subunit [Syntrophales bacterium]|nr:HlyD family efflux transporter periplasmic adaptor subunit [Syntrophales bacterium]